MILVQYTLKYSTRCSWLSPPRRTSWSRVRHGVAGARGRAAHSDCVLCPVHRRCAARQAAWRAFALPARRAARSVAACQVCLAGSALRFTEKALHMMFYYTHLCIPQHRQAINRCEMREISRSRRPGVPRNKIILYGRRAVLLLNARQAPAVLL